MCGIANMRNLLVCTFCIYVCTMWAGRNPKHRVYNFLCLYIIYIWASQDTFDLLSVYIYTRGWSWCALMCEYVYIRRRRRVGVCVCVYCGGELSICVGARTRVHGIGTLLRIIHRWASFMVRRMRIAVCPYLQFKTNKSICVVTSPPLRNCALPHPNTHAAYKSAYIEEYKRGC